MAQLKELKKVVKNHKIEWFFGEQYITGLRSLLNSLFTQDFVWANIGSPDEGLFLDYRKRVKVLSGEWLKMLFKIENSKEPISLQDIDGLRCIIFELETCISEKDSESVVKIDPETLEIHI